MKAKQQTNTVYNGFEQGPIRPPSEARSLLIRVTRNCPWNRCTFCPVYKGAEFSLRPVEHVIADIDMVFRQLETIHRQAGDSGPGVNEGLRRLAEKAPPDEFQAFSAAYHWYLGGMKSVFLQDANSLIIKPEDLIRILQHIRQRFPWIERITSYARSHTVARIGAEHLQSMQQAGLNRIHIGMESGSDQVLALVKKGASKAEHIKAGVKVKQAGMELSEYVMPGLGGRGLSAIHADETADALNRINPDFIRLRTLAVPNSVELFEALETGQFDKLTDLETAEEIRRFIEKLDGITSVIKSDHILNLFETVEGKLPEDKLKMTDILTTFITMAPEQRCLYQVGRRIGVFSGPDDMNIPARMARAQEVSRQFGVTPENVDNIIDELMKRFI